MSLNIDLAHFPHLSEHHREVAEHLVLLGCPPEQHIAQLEQIEEFVLGQRRVASEAQNHAHRSLSLRLTMS